MKSFALPVLALLALLWTAAPAAAEEARWIRYPALSPDGETIAFSYAGDLWTVPAAGGKARPLTSHVAYERSPVWSPDGRWIAFASDRYGNFDVFVVAATGGRARRLTWHSADDLPTDFSTDGARVIFTSRRLDAPGAVLGSTFPPELYDVPVEGGRPRQRLTTPALGARVGPGGRLVAYEDLKGYESPWRKHHTSSVARDLWTWEPATGAHRRLTTHRAEDRNPCWVGEDLLFLSERSGSFEVWRLGREGAAAAKVTSMGPHPVRFLTASKDGTLCFAYDGDLYRKPAQAEPTRVRVEVALGDRVNRVRAVTLRKGATEFAVSPSGDEVALIVRGEVFVTAVEHDTTKRVTATPEQERSLTWAPDGRTLYYASERNGSWNLYRASLAREEEKAFCRATRLEEAVVLEDEHETFQPLCSPDGKHLAYVLDRDAIAVLDLETGASRTLVPAERNYSYVDGDLAFEWSPDSKWLSFTMLEDGRWIDAVGVADVASGEIHNVTRSGYHEFGPHWSRDGRALSFFSTRHGRRSHQNRGVEADVLGLYLTPEAYDRARLSEEEFELLREKEEKEERKARRKGRGRGDEEEDDEDEEDETPPKPVRIDFERLEYQLARLTLHSAPVEDHVLSEDGETLFYTAKVGEEWGLWSTKIREKSTQRLVGLGEDRPGGMALSKDGKRLFVRKGGGQILYLEVGGNGGGRRGRGGRPGRGPRRGDDGEDGGGEGGGGRGGQAVAYAAEMQVDAPAERAHLYQHVWRQVREKFYDPELHGVDWKALGEHYETFLPHVRTGYDFGELLSELLGELNASHTGCRYRPRDREGAKTAALGLLYEVAHVGPGLVVAEVLVGGPADKSASKIGKGTVITAIDGVVLDDDVNPWALLDRKEDTPVLLTLVAGPGGETWEEVIRPISLRAESNLLYERWVRSREALTERLSNGRVGYVHVRGMGDSSFRRVFRDALGKYGAKEALVVDTRFNGGGWLHDELVGFLGGRPYAWFVPRGKTKGQMGSEPHQRWARPVCVIQNEANYSDAHFFPFAFKTLGMGKLVGAPVAGTATAVWWERLMDPDLVFGIPQVGMVDEDGRYLENQELEPDVLVLTNPEAQARGEDPQLEAAMKVLLP